MTMQEVRGHILKKTGYDVLIKTKQYPTPTIRKIFTKVVRDFCKNEIGANMPYPAIAKFLNLDNSTVQFQYHSDISFDIKKNKDIADIYYSYFPRKEKSIKDYKNENEELKKEIDRIKKLIK